MGRTGLRVWTTVCLVAAVLAVWRTPSPAIPLDKEGDITLGMRSYVNARVGMEATHDGVNNSDANSLDSATFPHSAAGHLRQNRAFIEVQLTHHLSRLVREGVGPFNLLNDLPFKVKDLEYRLTFRAEGDSLYDWGPREYSTATAFYQSAQAQDSVAGLLNQSFNSNLAAVDVSGARKQLRHLATDRERLFQAYLQGSVGNLSLRFGRQILAWGETDVFQLLDHINPIDNSFGGFLIALDERRVPLDMLDANYYLGDHGPFTEAYIEGFAAIDNSVGYYPGIPAGSAWSLPSLGNPSGATKTMLLRPARTIQNVRGGFRLVFNSPLPFFPDHTGTFTIAHYYTYFDTPELRVSTPEGHFPFKAFPDNVACAGDPAATDCGYPTHTMASAPLVQITGASTTFALPELYSVVRSEFAYFNGEPSYTQGQLDPFIFTGPRNVCSNPNGCSGGTIKRSSFNVSLGLDKNQWIRFLNPNQTFFISTQFFYKHIVHGANGGLYLKNGKVNPDREVLPIDLTVVQPTLLQGFYLEPVFITQPVDQFLQTLLIGTSYDSGQVNPSFALFYDWGGAFTYQPSITFIHDPFRFTLDYSIIDAHMYKGGSGISLLKDRDNIEFRFEYVI